MAMNLLCKDIINSFGVVPTHQIKDSEFAYWIRSFLYDSDVRESLNAIIRERKSKGKIVPINMSNQAFCDYVTSFQDGCNSGSIKSGNFFGVRSIHLLLYIYYEHKKYVGKTRCSDISYSLATAFTVIHNAKPQWLTYEQHLEKIGEHTVVSDYNLERVVRFVMNVLYLQYMMTDLYLQFSNQQKDASFNEKFQL